MFKIAVLISGGGTNLQSILDYGENYNGDGYQLFDIKDKLIGKNTNSPKISVMEGQQKIVNRPFKVEMVISSKEGVYGLERAKSSGVETHVISKKEYGDEMSNKILELTRGKVDLIVLAGYLSILEGEILREFDGRIINIHPSLIPSFCGPKMYGIKVHEAVIKSGVRYSGCTVHFVNDKVDGGEIILQEVVPVYFEDTATGLQQRVLVKEHEILPKAIELISRGKVKIIDGRVKIIE